MRCLSKEEDIDLRHPIPGAVGSQRREARHGVVADVEVLHEHVDMDAGSLTSLLPTVVNLAKDVTYFCPYETYEIPEVDRFAARYEECLA